MQQSNLIYFFGRNPFTRVLDALIDNLGESYTKKELQELASVSKGAFFAHWPKFEELGLFRTTRVIGKTAADRNAGYVVLSRCPGNTGRCFAKGRLEINPPFTGNAQIGIFDMLLQPGDLYHKFHTALHFRAGEGEQSGPKTAGCTSAFDIQHIFL